MYGVRAMVPFMPPLPVLPAAKNSGTRLVKWCVASVCEMLHCMVVELSTDEAEHGSMAEKSEVDGPKKATVVPLTKLVPVSVSVSVAASVSGPVAGCTAVTSGWPLLPVPLLTVM